MLKRTLVLILAACMLLCSEAFANQATEAEDGTGKIIYEDEALIVRTGGIISEEDFVTVKLTIENNGTRSCVVMAEVSETIMEGEFLAALKKMKQINGGELLRSIAPGEAVTYNVSWEIGEDYTESFLAMLIPALQPEEITAVAEGIPKDTIGGLSIVLSEEKFEDHVGTLEDFFNALGGEDTGLNEKNTRFLELRIVSAK